MSISTARTKTYIKNRIQKPTAEKPVPVCRACGEKIRDPETTVYIKRKDKTEQFFHPGCFLDWSRGK